MASQLMDMIVAQPRALRAVAALDVSEHVQRLSPAISVHVVGTGTSFHAAELGADLLRHGGLDAHAVRSADFVGWRGPLREGDAVVVISHTGQTAHAREARRLALAAGVPVVSITGEQAGWPEAIVTPTRERSETYTVSYTAALAVLGRLAAGLTGVATGSDEIARVAREVDAVLADPAIDHIAVPKRALALIGPGIWGVTAREGALKLRESAHVLAEGFDSETLLHGAAVPLGSEDVLVGLQPQADQDGLTGLLLAAAGAEGITTYELDARSAAGSPAQTFLAQITLTVRLQLLAARFSQARGTNPDKVITGAWARDELWSTGALRE